MLHSFLEHISFAFALPPREIYNLFQAQGPPLADRYVTAFKGSKAVLTAMPCEFRLWTASKVYPSPKPFLLPLQDSS